MRLLPERPDHDRQGAARQESASDRRADSRGHGRHAVPLHDVLPHPGRHQARGEGDGAHERPRRRRFRIDSRRLLESDAASRGGLPQDARAARRQRRRRGRRRRRSRRRSAQAAGPYPDPDFRQLDSWIVIHQDNTATFYVGKTDCGQGTGTAFRQMMSDELDIAYDKTTCIMGSTDITVDQGGSGGSDAIQTDGWPMRRVAAEARRVLLEMASTRFGVPVDQLAVSDGVITVKADPSKQRHLRRTDRRQAVQRRADRQQHRRDDRRGEGEAGAGAEDRRPVAAALRHSRQGGRLAEVGRGREAARHGARAQREAAGRRREAGQHRRVVRAQPARIRQGREQGQLRRGRLRARRAGDQRGADSSR